MTILRNQAKAALATANASLATANASLATTNAEVVSLNALVTQRTSERNAAQGQAANLQAQLNAISSPLAVAEQQVQREVGWVENSAAGPTPSIYSKDALTGLSTMDYVAGHVSAGAYGYLELNGLPLPTSDPNSILTAQAGICGHAAIVFAKIMGSLGYQVRSAQFYWTDPVFGPDSHIAVEVNYDGGWHFFDPTFGLFWTGANGNVLSITDVRSTGGTEHKNEIAYTNLIEDPWFSGDDTAFETDPATTATLGQDPLSALSKDGKG
jgi:Transglutaminase-like superfamily